jgi:hypothetical protein
MVSNFLRRLELRQKLYVLVIRFDFMFAQNALDSLFLEWIGDVDGEVILLRS